VSELPILRVEVNTLLTPRKGSEDPAHSREPSMGYRHPLTNCRTTDFLSSPNDLEQLVWVLNILMLGQSVDEFFKCPGFTRCCHLGYDEFRV